MSPIALNRILASLVRYRWNVLGFQGSLMSYFTEPLYFSSIIVGSLYHAAHMSRAMYGRIGPLEALPPGFCLNRPLLSGETDAGNARFLGHGLHQSSLTLVLQE